MPTPNWWRRLRRTIRKRTDCLLQRCDYYTDYLARGPADMPHGTFHHVERQAIQHMDNCQRPGICYTCSDYERRLRA